MYTRKLSLKVGVVKKAAKSVRFGCKIDKAHNEVLPPICYSPKNVGNSHSQLEKLKKAEEALNKTNEMIQRLIQTSPLAIICTDSEGKTTLWNPTAELMFGWSQEEVLGKESPAIPKGKYPEALQLYHKLMQGESVTGLEAHRQTKSGQPLDVSIWAFPLFDPTGKVIHIVAVLFDITARKKTEENLRQAKEAAETANKAKSRFLANVSHEIRTPLGAILGFTDIMLNTEQSRNDRASSLQVLHRNGKHLLQLIDDLLDISKIEACQLDIEKIRFSLLIEISSTLSAIQQQAKEKGLELSVHYDGLIPETILSDPTRLRQILINLLNNAEKFTEQGHISLRVRLCGSHKNPKKQMLEIKVSDTGIGIPRDQRSDLFKMFFQADNSSGRKFGGSGLGLALSKRLAQALGGDLVLSDKPSNKMETTFVVTIDPGSLNEVRLMSYPKPFDLFSAKPPTQSSQESLLTDIHVLVVEDCADNQVLTRSLLKLAGANVDIAKDGVEGVEMALKGNYDVILLDIQMPGLDGHQAASLLRKKGYTKPIVALTAHAMREERKRCLEVGCDGYLSKPVDSETLVRTTFRFARTPK